MTVDGQESMGSLVTTARLEEKKIEMSKKAKKVESKKRRKRKRTEKDEDREKKKRRRIIRG
jgi:hypothetical protein